MDRSRLAVGAVALGLGGAAAAVVTKRLSSSQPAVEYVLHVYDHCPFCNRVEWLMQQNGLAYKRVLYGYGAGAKPEMAAEGFGYEASGAKDPKRLTGQKMLPVLEGPGVPCAPGQLGLPESMEICAFLIGRIGPRGHQEVHGRADGAQARADGAPHGAYAHR